MGIELSAVQREELKRLMRLSAEKGNLPNSGVVLEGDKTIAYEGSWVASDHDATAHSERLLVEKICKLREKNYTPGLTMISVVEPCVMCMSACSQAGYKAIGYIIPAAKYVDRIAWMTDSVKTDKQKLAADFSESLELVHLTDYEDEFCAQFEQVIGHLV